MALLTGRKHQGKIDAFSLGVACDTGGRKHKRHEFFLFLLAGFIFGKEIDFVEEIIYGHQM